MLFSMSVIYHYPGLLDWSQGSFSYETASPAYWVLDAQT